MVKYVDIIPVMSAILSASSTPLHCDDVRKEIATRMGVDPISLGMTKSTPQKMVWNMLCGHAFEDLKNMGKVSSRFMGAKGAMWKWEGAMTTPAIVEPIVEPKVEPIVEAKIEPKVEPIVEPKVEPIVEPIVEAKIEAKATDPLSILKDRAIKESSHQVFYDLTDPLLRSLMIKNTPCFSTYLAKDSECQICPLASECLATKQAKDKEKAELKAYKEEHKEELEAEKVKAQYLKTFVAKGVNLNLSKLVSETKLDLVCPLTQENIPKGSSAVFIPSYGVISIKASQVLGLTF